MAPPVVLSPVSGPVPVPGSVLAAVAVRSSVVAVEVEVEVVGTSVAPPVGLVPGVVAPESVSGAVAPESVPVGVVAVGLVPGVVAPGSVLEVVAPGSVPVLAGVVPAASSPQAARTSRHARAVRGP